MPDWVYTDQRIYEREHERIFLGPTWNYVALEAELPRPGDYIRSYIGSVPIIVARDQDGRVHAFENCCAHRGAEFCKTYRGSTQRFICPYHQWTYDLSGALMSVPFRRGVKGKGGLPEDFKLDAHHLRNLNIACRNGVIFASRHDDMELLEAYLGPVILSQFELHLRWPRPKNPRRTPQHDAGELEALSGEPEGSLSRHAPSHLSHDIRFVRCRQ